MRDRLPEDVRGDHVDLVLAEWRKEQPRLCPARSRPERELRPLWAQPHGLGCFGCPAPRRSAVPALPDRALPLPDAHLGRDDAPRRPARAGGPGRADRRPRRPPRAARRPHPQRASPHHTCRTQPPRDRATDARGTDQARASRAGAAAEKVADRPRTAIPGTPPPAAAGRTWTTPAAATPGPWPSDGAHGGCGSEGMKVRRLRCELP